MGNRICDDKDVALKSFFLGPQAENGDWVKVVVAGVFERWFDWRRSLYPGDGNAISDRDQSSAGFLERRSRFEAVLDDLVIRFEKEVPKFSPRYVGHMFSEISLPALFGHIITLLHNPNNISGESSRVGVKIEEEAVSSLLSMIGFIPGSSNGHFTSGGTIANFEALVRARERMGLWLAAGAYANALGSSRLSLFEAAQMGWDSFDSIGALCEPGNSLRESIRSWNVIGGNPWLAARNIKAAFDTAYMGPVVLAPRHKHYSWTKGVELLGFGAEALWPVELGADGRIDVSHLELQLTRARQHGRPVLMVVSVAGTTELGQIDPIDEVQNLLDRWQSHHGAHIWHHVDAAYGGFFCSLGGLEDEGIGRPAARALAAIGRASSVTLDPHKLGYVPYSSGAFLCRRKRDYEVKSFGAPYIQFDQQCDRGTLTLEGSRSAAGAVATWMTANTIGLDREGYGRLLARTIRIRRQLAVALTQSSPLIKVAPHGETNILCFAMARPGEPVSVSNARTLRIHDALSTKEKGPFFVSMTKLTWEAYGPYLNQFVKSWSGEVDTDELVLVRMCLMNPFFESVEMNIDYRAAFMEVLAGLAEPVSSGG